MAGEVWINDVDLGVLGIRVESVTGGRSLTPREWPIRPLPGVGQASLTDTPTPGARRIVLKCSQAAPSLAELEELRRQLVWYLKRPSTEVRVADRAGAFQRCVVVGADIPPVGPWARDTRPAHFLEIELLAADPAFYHAEETVIEFGADTVACPVGNAPSFPAITVTGPITNPVVSYRAADGTLRRVMTLNIDLEEGDSITVDSATGTVVDGDGESRMSVPGDGLWMIVIEPGDAAGPNGPWPTIQIGPTPLAEGAGGTATYRIANE